MKTLIILLAMFVAAPAAAVDLVCTVPAAAVTRAGERCEILRGKRQVRAGEWSNDICATEILRLGLLAVERSDATRTAQMANASAVNDAVSANEANHPSATTSVACGDGTADAEFGEACDDGNRENGDGCSDVCESE